MTDQTIERFCFGRSAVLPRRRELSYDNAIVEIGDRAFDLLLALIEGRGSAISKDRLMALVWSGRIVEENTLESQISILRRALGDDRKAIRTVSGRGYQFVGDLKGSVRPPLLSSQQSRVLCVDLPASLSALVGRDTALREITELAASHRLVTLVGAGGIGKTRLAIESARQLASRFPERVCLAELASTTSSEFLPMTIARALGFPPGEGTPSFDRIAANIQDKQILLVLDNCEHLVEAAARITENLLRALPGATVIATSREALRITGEYVYRVASLDVPPDDFTEGPEQYGAVQLFRARVGSEIVCFRSSDHSLALEARICRQLDGIPLAIELAAACVSVFGLRGVADRLTDRFQLLTQGMRTALPRQQTLRATLDWSYALLSRPEQIVLARLSVFADSFSLESAQAVLSFADMASDNVAGCVIGLINKSLVSAINVAGRMRYRLLETTRAYARDKLLAGGDLRELSYRHARHYLAVFQQSESEAEFRADVDWSATYGPHLEDLRAAVSWGLTDEGDAQVAVDLTIASVPLSMRLALLEECLARVNASLGWLDKQPINADERRMKLYAARGACLLYQSAGKETGLAFKAALAIAEALGDAEYQMRGIWGCWSYSYLNGLYADTLAFAYRFGKLASASPHKSDDLVANRLIGIAHLFLGELDDARMYLERTLERHASSSRVHRMRFLYDEKMLVSSSLSHTMLFQGFPDQAMRVAEQAFESARELDHLPSLCFALSEAVCTAALTTGSDTVLETAVAELAHATRRHGVSTWKARARMWEAFLQLRSGNSEVFERVIKPALEEIGIARFFVTLSPFLSAVSQVLGAQGRVVEGMALVIPAIERAQQSGDECSLAELMRAKGELMLLMKSPATVSDAEKVLAEAQCIAHQRRFLTWELRCAISLARLWHSHGKSQEARELLQGVYSRFSEGWGTADLVAARTLIASFP